MFIPKLMCNCKHWDLELKQDYVLVFNSASSGGGGGRGAPQHYPKTASNRYVILLFSLA